MGKVFVNLYLIITLVGIPRTLFIEVEGYAIFCDFWGATPRSGVDGHFDSWRPPIQLMTSMFGSGVTDGVGCGVVYHVFVSRIRVPRVPWDLLILVESVVLPTEPPPGAQWGAAILVTRGWEVQNLDFQALRTPCLCEESVWCV